MKVVFAVDGTKSLEIGENDLSLSTHEAVPGLMRIGSIQPDGSEVGRYLTREEAAQIGRALAAWSEGRENWWLSPGQSEKP